MEKEEENQEESEEDFEDELDLEDELEPQEFASTTPIRLQSIQPTTSSLETQPITNLEQDLENIPTSKESTENKNQYEDTQLNYLESNTTSSYEAGSTDYVATTLQPNNQNTLGVQPRFAGAGNLQGQSQRKDQQYTPQALQREEQKGGIPPSRNRGFR